MDKLKLKIEQRENTAFVNKAVLPIINGSSLIDLLKTAEAEYERDIAGAYDGISPEDFFNEAFHFQDKAKSRILECDCGIEGCWSFLVKITEKDNLIEWNYFEQIYRSNWKYFQLEPFQFDKENYLKELGKLKE